ncbi:hypothetical protein DF182_17425 [Chitinophaga flava]|uniref:Uncharacterized protein n=1 Tax=Chitinophaga flava TaxID=2259036 RepID=A0A365XPU2_9BACT|nr:hypothetical protein DF182_17425 [Chitinophaga flava]
MAAISWLSKFIRNGITPVMPTLFMVFGNPNWLHRRTNLIKVKPIQRITYVHFIHFIYFKYIFVQSAEHAIFIYHGRLEPVMNMTFLLSEKLKNERNPTKKCFKIQKP